jgi:hypothetical protein
MFARILLRPRLSVFVCGLCVAAVAVANPNWAKAVGVDVWNLPALNEEVRSSEEESASIDVEDDNVRARIALKESLIAQLLAGRATLAETTDKFAALNANRPGCMSTIRATHSGTSDRECLARNVITFATSRVPAEQEAELLCHLEAELQEMLTEEDAD